MVAKVMSRLNILLRGVILRCLVATFCLLHLGLFVPLPAIAAIRQLEETPGQIVYQSRQRLKDEQGQFWQAIAFKRILATGEESLFLRLVGFPGTVDIDRTLPLRFTNSLGATITALDASSQIFTDSSSPEPQVGQYDLQPVIDQLRAELPWQLTLPTLDQSPVQLQIPPMLIAEWQCLAETDSQSTITLGSQS